MPAIDQLLKLVVSQGANELRIGTDRSPAMFASGAQRTLTMPVMHDDSLRYLLGPLLSDEREALLRRDGQLEFSWFVADVGTFHVAFTRRGPQREGPLVFDGVFRHGPAQHAVPPPAPPSPPEPRAPQWASAEAPTSIVDSARVPSSIPPLTSAAPLTPMPVTLVDAIPRSLEGGVMREAPRALASLLSAVAERKASDVHLRSGEPPHIRLDGKLRPLSEASTESVEALLEDLLGGVERQRLGQGLSVDLSLQVPGAGRFRLNVYRTSEGLSLAARALPVNVPTLESLHLPVPLDELVDLPHGLVLVTGPTGAGKSTTLAALAQEALRRRPALLISLEDPIEYALAPLCRGSLVRQRQIGRDVASFATGLRDALREDPDVLVVGEMRDPESIALALTAAETGHLVLTSMHSRSSASAIERIVDTYPPERQRQVRVQLADALRAVVAQRLLPRARGSGRIPALEVLRVTHAVASHIREGKTEQIMSALQTGRREGMLPLERCLADLARAQHVTVEQARLVANDPNALTEYLRGTG